MSQLISLDELKDLAHIVQLKPTAQKPMNEKLMIDYFDIIKYLNAQKNE